MSESATVVIGGGIVGLACAYELAVAGHDVHLVDRNLVGTGSSGGNAGWVTLSHCFPVPSPGSVREALRSAGRAESPLYVRPSMSPAFLRWLYAFQRHCRPAAFDRGAAALSALAADSARLLERWGADGVDTTLTRPGLVHAFLDEDEAERTLALQRRLALGRYPVPDSPSTGAAIREIEPSLGREVQAAYAIEGEGLVDPGGLVASLAERLLDLGATITEHAVATGFVVERGQVRAVVVDGTSNACSSVVVAAGTWSADLLKKLGAPVLLQSGKGYSFSVDLPAPPKHPIYLGDKHVAVSPLGGTTRMSGTMEFSGNNRRLDWRRIEAIAAASRHYLGPWYETNEDLIALIAHPWVGGRPMLPDGLPLIDRVPHLDNAFVATGHGMLGVTLAPTTAAAVAHYVANNERPRVLEPFAFTRPWRHS